MAFNPFLYSGIYLKCANIIFLFLVKGTGTTIVKHALPGMLG